MSGKLELLIEIGCEEIPARMLPGATGSLAQAILSILDKAGLAHGQASLFWSPRRIAVKVPQTQAATEPKEQTLLGPPARAAWDAEGKATRAAEGFAAKQGLTAADLQRVQTDKGEYAAAVVKKEALSLGTVLSGAFEKSVRGISFPKTMRWGDGVGPFVRPVHWLVALAGDQVLPLSLFGIAAGRESWTHRALSPEPVSIADASGWEDALAEASVIVDPRRRRAELLEALRRQARQAGGQLTEDEGLLAESADMVELPAAIAGTFEQTFVEELPEEVLATCLKHHQKAFSVHDDEGVMARFAVAVNMPTDPEGHIQRGHEWVNSGRLEDALFFWREDRKTPLAARGEQLEGVVFQRELGTYAAKTRRLAVLARALGTAAGLDDTQLEHLQQAAALSRCDLVTGLVGEFPELQGVAGGLLARADGLPEKVCQAVYGLYQPASADDPVPAEELTRWLGLADRLDTLAGGFAVGLVPSGSKDPFALRRAGLSSVRLAAACQTDLRQGIELALAGYRGGDTGPDLASQAAETLEQLTEFLLERFGALAAREGARYDEIKALRGAASEQFCPADLLERAAALREFRESEDFLALASAAKRVRNILAQARKRGDAVEAGQNEEALAEPAEKELAAKLAEAGHNVAARRAESEIVAGLEALASLRPAVDRFFDEILVMADEPSLRLGRLGLLARFDQLAHEIVDLSALVVEGK